MQLAARASNNWNAAHNGRTCATSSITSSSGVNSRGMYERSEESNSMLSIPTMTAYPIVTLAEILAGPTRVAPMRFATRVLPEIERGKGTWNIILAMVERTDWAAKGVVPRYDDAKVSTSKARHSASTITRPGKASRIIGPQLRKALVVNPLQHSAPSMKYT